MVMRRPAAPCIQRTSVRVKYIPAEALERLIGENVMEINTDKGLVYAIVEEANTVAKTG